MCPADPEVRRGQEKASEKGKGVLRWEWGLVGSLWETKGGKSGEGGCGSPREGYLGVVSNAV